MLRRGMFDFRAPARIQPKVMRVKNNIGGLCESSTLGDRQHKAAAVS